VVFHLKEATAEVEAWRVIDSPRQPVIAYSSFRVYEADHKDSTINVFTRLRFSSSFVYTAETEKFMEKTECARDRTLYQNTATQPKARRKLNFKIFFKVQELGNKILVLKGLVWG